MNSFKILMLGVIVVFIGIIITIVKFNVQFQLISLIGIIIMVVALIKQDNEHN